MQDNKIYLIFIQSNKKQILIIINPLRNKNNLSNWTNQLETSDRQVSK